MTGTSSTASRGSNGSSRLFIHVGLPKTATTYLQQNVFPSLSGVTFLGKAKCVNFHDVFMAESRKVLISHEHLLACPFESYPGGWRAEFTRRLTALSRTFPEAQIMLSFRDHASLLTSYYKEYISKPGRPPLSREQFFDPDSNRGHVKIEDLYFRDLIELVRERFERPPFVFLFEDVVIRLPVFLRDLSACIGEPAPAAVDIPRSTVNPGVRDLQAGWLMRLHRIDAVLKRMPLVPDLYNPLFRKLGIQPDRLCRKHLAFISKRPLELNDVQQAFLRTHYRSDWLGVLAYVERQRSVLHPDGTAAFSRPAPSIDASP